MDELKATLAVQEAELKQKNEDADKLIHVVGVETEKVSKEKAIADEEELKVQAINTVRGAGQHLLAAPTAPRSSPRRKPSTRSTRYGRAQLCGCGTPGAPCPAVLSAPCSLPRTT